MTNMGISGYESYGNERYFSVWSGNEVYVKRVSYSCGNGYYYNEVNGECMLCTTGCTALGCSECTSFV